MMMQAVQLFTTIHRQYLKFYELSQRTLNPLKASNGKLLPFASCEKGFDDPNEAAARAYCQQLSEIDSRLNADVARLPAAGAGGASPIPSQNQSQHSTSAEGSTDLLQVFAFITQTSMALKHRQSLFNLLSLEKVPEEYLYPNRIIESAMFTDNEDVLDEQGSMADEAELEDIINEKQWEDEEERTLGSETATPSSACLSTVPISIATPS